RLDRARERLARDPARPEEVAIDPRGDAGALREPPEELGRVDAACGEQRAQPLARRRRVAGRVDHRAVPELEQEALALRLDAQHAALLRGGEEAQQVLERLGARRALEVLGDVARLGLARPERDVARRGEVMAGSREVTENRVAPRVERAGEAALDRLERLAQDAELALELVEPVRARVLRVLLDASHTRGLEGSTAGPIEHATSPRATDPLHAGRRARRRKTFGTLRLAQSAPL